MKYIIPGILILLFTIIIILLFKIYKQRKQYRKKYSQKMESALAKEYAEERLALQKIQDARKAYEENFALEKQQNEQQAKERAQSIEKYVATLEEKKSVYEASLNETEAHGRQLIDEKLQSYYNSNKDKFERLLRETENLIRADAKAILDQEFNQALGELVDLRAEVDEYRMTQATINEQILRQRAIDEQQDFYRICITDADLEDIKLLLTTKNQLHKTSFLDKIIYDTYISKYVKEMSKRVLSGKDPSGIYKVTNIKTKEIYIGKSTNVATRWSNHCKSAFGLEGVADSQFQRALKKYGIQSFTWELLEEAPKDILTTRERFYIDFYDTTKFGYNMKAGG